MSYDSSYSSSDDNEHSSSTDDISMTLDSADTFIAGGPKSPAASLSHTTSSFTVHSGGSSSKDSEWTENYAEYSSSEESSSESTSDSDPDNHHRHHRHHRRHHSPHHHDQHHSESETDAVSHEQTQKHFEINTKKSAGQQTGVFSNFFIILKFYLILISFKYSLKQKKLFKN